MSRKDGGVFPLQLSRFHVMPYTHFLCQTEVWVFVLGDLGTDITDVHEKHKRQWKVSSEIQINM